MCTPWLSPLSQNSAYIKTTPLLGSFPAPDMTPLHLFNPPLHLFSGERETTTATTILFSFQISREREVTRPSRPLATSGQKTCSSLVCSCYSIHSCSGEANGAHNGSSLFSSQSSSSQEPSLQSKKPPLAPLKSNLRKPLTKGEQRQRRSREVSWPDAHGRDLAHVLVFHSSEVEERELHGVKNSCVCAIQ